MHKYTLSPHFSTEIKSSSISIICLFAAQRTINRQFISPSHKQPPICKLTTEEKTLKLFESIKFNNFPRFPPFFLMRIFFYFVLFTAYITHSIHKVIDSSWFKSSLSNWQLYYLCSLAAWYASPIAVCVWPKTGDWHKNCAQTLRRVRSFSK